MSPTASPGGDGRPARGPRNAVVAVALLVLVLVVVLAGLLGDGSDGSVDASPTGQDASPGAAASPWPGRGSATRAPTPAPSRDPESGLRVVALDSLPRQARDTVALIDRGGPFPYAQDGATFANRERRLPAHPRGWYREYTVRTPGEGDRGPRRIVTGDDDRLVFYTGDHYDSFVRVAA